MRLNVCRLGSLLLIASAITVTRSQDNPLTFKQDLDNAALVELSPSEFAALDDPFFNLVLKTRANITGLAELESLLQPDANKRATFVVDERIVQTTQPDSRRAVIAFEGTNANEPLQGNVMLSISFPSSGFPENPAAIEAWGWDNRQGRYNYYKMDRSGRADGVKRWKFRGSSENADRLQPAARAGTCVACHINGAPIMKELFAPWNNWHSPDFLADYLRAGANAWPVAGDLRFRTTLRTADRLETNFLVGAIRRFNASRINRTIQRSDITGDRSVSGEGFQSVLDGQRLLRPLFRTTEINLISSFDRSGSHALGAPNEFVPNGQIRWPATLFLNAPLIAGGRASYNGLKISDALKFQTLPRITQQQNRQLLTELNVRLANATPGDAHFALLVPEPSHIDNDLADQLLKQGIITPHFLAAVLSIDLENPVLSSRRAELLQFVPKIFEFRPVTAGTDPTALPRTPADDKLTEKTVAAIDTNNPVAGSPAAELRDLLRANNAVEALKAKVVAYFNRVNSRLSSNDPQERLAELKTIYQKMISTRKQMLADPTLKALDETNGQLLLPVPAN